MPCKSTFKIFNLICLRHSRHTTFFSTTHSWLFYVPVLKISYQFDNKHSNSWSQCLCQNTLLLGIVRVFDWRASLYTLVLVHSSFDRLKDVSILLVSFHCPITFERIKLFVFVLIYFRISNFEFCFLSLSFGYWWTNFGRLKCNWKSMG